MSPDVSPRRASRSDGCRHRRLRQGQMRPRSCHAERGVPCASVIVWAVARSLQTRWRATEGALCLGPASEEEWQMVRGKQRRLTERSRGRLLEMKYMKKHRGVVGTSLSLVLWERQRTSAGSLPRNSYGKTSRASREMSAFLVDTVDHGDADTCR